MLSKVRRKVAEGSRRKDLGRVELIEDFDRLVDGGHLTNFKQEADVGIVPSATTCEQLHREKEWRSCDQNLNIANGKSDFPIIWLIKMACKHDHRIV